MRVTLSLDRQEALAAPGYGFVASAGRAGLDARDGRGRRRVPLAAPRRDGGGQPPAEAARHPGRHRALLQRLGATRRHHVPHAGGQDAPPHDGLADVRAEPQGRQRLRAGRPAPHGCAFLPGGRHLRSTRRRALLRLRPAPGGLPRPPRPRAPVLARLPRLRRAERVRAVHGDELRLRPRLGQPVEDAHRAGDERAHPLDLRGRQPRLLLRDRGQDERRDLRRLPPPHGRDAPAAQGGLRLHPVQAALHQPGRGAEGREGIPRARAAGRRDGGRLVLLHEDGPDGLHPREVAGPGGDEPAAPRHGLRDDDQRLAALHEGRALLRLPAEEGLVHAPRRRHADRRPALRPRRLRRRHHEPRGRALVLGDDPRQRPEQGLRLALGRPDRARPAARTAPTSTSGPARASSTSTRWSTRRRSTRASAATCRTAARSRSRATPTSARSATARSSGPPTSSRPGTR